MKIPKLLFGVATSDHQAEAYDPAHPDFRDEWERRSGQTLRGKATDFWNRYSEDIDNARHLGCKIFRFSLSWARIEPQPQIFDPFALKHYQDIVIKVIASDMIPLVTLHHFTWPIHIQSRGGTIAEEFPEWFSGYVSRTLDSLGDRVTHWITFNEPNLLVYGYIKPWWQNAFIVPPGYTEETSLATQIENVPKIMRNLFVAHRLARTLIKAKNPDAHVGSNPFVLGLPSGLQSLLDWLVATASDHPRLARRTRAIAQRPVARTAVDVVLSQLTPTSSRSGKISFSKPYGRGLRRLLIRRDHVLSSLRDLEGKRVGFVRGSTALSTLTRAIPAAIPCSFETHTEALASLQRGVVDAVVGDDAAYAAVGIPANVDYGPEVFGEDVYATGMARGKPDLLALVNAVIEGKSTPPGIQTARGGAVSRIRKRGVLKVGILPDQRSAAGASLLTAERRIAGEIAHRILGDSKKVKFIEVTLPNRIKALVPWYDFLGPLLKAIGLVTTILNSNWWHLGMCGRLPEFLCPRDCVGQQDYVGLDYYWGINVFELHRIYQLLEATMSNFTDAPVDPPGLLRAVRRLNGWFRNCPIWIIENGCVETADGFNRARYLTEHIQQVELARSKDIPVSAYICWSITSNREWGLPFSSASDFGLYKIELDKDPELQRHPTKSSTVYKNIIQRLTSKERA
ncbi:MAG: family 1 glycosylhydrolase [Verrucomicrobia bacterium]|nr:family 1 glycosylhydrolase [Verrucomicrobiota bacterium]